MATPRSPTDFLRLPVVSLAAEHLVMGYLLRRNILTYKAPPGNEGYDLICIHPDVHRQQSSAVRVQVKSRYATDCDRGFPVKEATLSAFDFLVVAFLNIGKFAGKNDGTVGLKEPEFFTLPAAFIREHHDASTSWQKGGDPPWARLVRGLSFEFLRRHKRASLWSRGNCPPWSAQYLSTTWFWPQSQHDSDHVGYPPWQKVSLRGLAAEIEPYRGEAGVELIAQAVGVERPKKVRGNRGSTE